MFSAFGQLLPGFTCIAFSAYYLASNAKKKNPYFLLLTTIATIFYLCDAGYVINKYDYDEVTIVDFIAQFAYTALTPAVFQFLYFENTGKETSKWAILTYLPSIVIGIISAICIISIGKLDMTYVIQGIEKNEYHLPHNWSGIYKLYFINNFMIGRGFVATFEGLMIGYLTYLIIIRSRKRDGSGNRMILICILLLLLYISHMTKSSFDRTALVELQWLCGIVSFGWAVIIAGIGIEYSYRPSATVGIDNKNNSTSYKHTPLRDQVLDYIDNCKNFLNPELTLNSMADELGTNRTYLSAMFNKEFNCNFREFINGRRIEYAKSCMLSNNSTQIKDIAEASGFTSVSQFCRKFKEAEGVSPATWLKEQS